MPVTPQMKLRSKQLYGGMQPGEGRQTSYLGSPMADSLALSPPAYEGAPDYSLAGPLGAPPPSRLLGNAVRTTGPSTAYQSRLAAARTPLSQNTGLLRDSLTQTMGLTGARIPKTDIQLGDEQRARDQYVNEQIMGKMQANPNGRFWSGAQLGQTVGPTGVVRPGFVSPTPEVGTGTYPGGYRQWKDMQSPGRSLADLAAWEAISGDRVPPPAVAAAAPRVEPFNANRAGYLAGREAKLAGRQALVTQNAQAREYARNSAPQGGGLMGALAMRNPRLALQFAEMNQRGMLAQQELGLRGQGLQLQAKGLENEARLGGERNALLGQQIQAQIAQQGQQHLERLEEMRRSGKISENQFAVQVEGLKNQMAQATLQAQERGQQHSALMAQNQQQHEERMGELRSRNQERVSQDELARQELRLKYNASIEEARTAGNERQAQRLERERDQAMGVQTRAAAPGSRLLPAASAPATNVSDYATLDSFKGDPQAIHDYLTRVMRIDPNSNQYRKLLNQYAKKGAYGYREANNLSGRMSLNNFNYILDDTGNPVPSGFLARAGQDLFNKYGLGGSSGNRPFDIVKPAIRGRAVR